MALYLHISKFFKNWFCFTLSWYLSIYSVRISKVELTVVEFFKNCSDRNTTHKSSHLWNVSIHLVRNLKVEQTAVEFFKNCSNRYSDHRSSHLWYVSIFSVGIFTEHKGGIYKFFVRWIHYTTGRKTGKSQLCAFEQLKRNSVQKSNRLCLLC